MSKFKVGDKVKRVHCDSNYGMNIGDIGTISSLGVKFPNHFNLKEYETDGSDGTFFQDYYELVEDKPKSTKFKVGDKVKVIKKPSSSTKSIGTIYVIGEVAVLLSTWYCEFEDDCNGCTADELELVEDKPKFKVGDKVRLIKEVYHISNGKIGNIFTLTNPQNDNQLTKWWFINDTQGIYESYFELVEQECKPCGTSFRERQIVSDYQVQMEHSTSIAKAWQKVYQDAYLGECSGFPLYVSKNLPINNNKQTFMSKATNYIKNLTLSADEKLLRKYGFKDSCGDYTSEAMDLVEAKLVKDNEDYLIEIAKGLELEAKDSK